MNEAHLQYLASPEWAQTLKSDLLPWLLSMGGLGDDVLEIGPGPGLTTDLLRARTRRVTAVEVDPSLATDLAARMRGTNVTVIEADATQSGLPSEAFSAVTCFSMLHHMTSPALQDVLFGEVHRLLRPGGMFVGVDSVDTDLIRQAHHDDVFVPVSPDTLASRLQAAGLTDPAVERGEYQIRFNATKALGEV